MGEFCIYHYEESRGREVYPVSASHALKLGLKASQASAENGWTAHEMELVDKAIKRIAMTKFTFTADDVWQVLGFQFPVTKGMAARLSKAARDGIIVNTGTIGYAKRGGEHDHNQRLTIWQSTLVMAG
jgi:hypothetical protein